MENLSTLPEKSEQLAGASVGINFKNEQILNVNAHIHTPYSFSVTIQRLEKT